MSVDIEKKKSRIFSYLIVSSECRHLIYIFFMLLPISRKEWLQGITNNVVYKVNRLNWSSKWYMLIKRYHSPKNFIHFLFDCNY